MKKLEDFLQGKLILSQSIEIVDDVKNADSEPILTPYPGLYESDVEVPDYLLNSPELVGYPDLEMQEQIYEWVKESLPIHHYSIKDFGCGRGDIYPILTRNLFDDSVGVQYFGIESRKSLIESGLQKYPGIQLINNDFLDVDLQTDYTICIGTLNDKHTFGKWEYFNKTLNHALSNTNKAIIFVLSSSMDDLDNFYDYPLDELFANLPSYLPIKLDYSKFQDIYKLTVHIGSFN